MDPTNVKIPVNVLEHQIPCGDTNDALVVVIGVTQNTPQNRVSDNIMHVTLLCT
jgi:hypothetical protein